MNKNVITIICLCGFFIAAWVTVRVTHTLTFYSIRSAANQPNLKPGQLITASSLRSADIGRFVCFKAEPREYTDIFRCIAKGGDSIEIKGGTVYVNGKKMDEPYTWNQYYISKAQLNSLRNEIAKNNYPVYDSNDSLSTITFAAADMKNYHLKLQPAIIPKSQIDSTMFPLFVNFRYNRDNFGPIKIPKDCYFLMGDNRHNAYDSRYLGFIKSKDIICTVIH